MLTVSYSFIMLYLFIPLCINLFVKRAVPQRPERNWSCPHCRCRCLGLPGFSCWVNVAKVTPPAVFKSHRKQYWLVVWSMNFIFPFSWESSQLTIFQRDWNHQPVTNTNQILTIEEYHNPLGYPTTRRKGRHSCLKVTFIFGQSHGWSLFWMVGFVQN